MLTSFGEILKRIRINLASLCHVVLLLPVTEICNNPGEYIRVDVLTELHQDQPVSKVKSLHDDSDVLDVAGLGACAEDKNTAVSESLKLMLLTHIPLFSL